MRPTEQADTYFTLALNDVTLKTWMTPEGRYKVHLAIGLKWLATAIRATYMKLEEIDRKLSPSHRGGRLQLEIGEAQLEK